MAKNRGRRSAHPEQERPARPPLDRGRHPETPREDRDRGRSIRDDKVRDTHKPSKDRGSDLSKRNSWEIRITPQRSLSSARRQPTNSVCRNQRTGRRARIAGVISFLAPPLRSPLRANMYRSHSHARSESLRETWLSNNHSHEARHPPPIA